MRKQVWLTLFLLTLGCAGSSYAQTAASYINAGNQMYAAKDYAKAVQYYQAAANMDPNSASAFQGLGNSHYGLGQKSEALAAYEKALQINPNNSQLSTFVQSLRAQMGSAPPASTEPAASNPDAIVTKPVKTFEINPFIGVGVGASTSVGATLTMPATTIGMTMGFGGGVEGYYLVDGRSLGVGLVIDYFTGYGVASTPTTFPYALQGGGAGTGTIEPKNNSSVIEIMPAIKYKFEGNTLRPYLLASAGFAFISSSATIDVKYGSGPPLVAFPALPTAPAVSTSGPVIQAGAGAEFSLGPDMGIFLQAKYSMIFVGGTTVAATPLTPAFTTPGYTFSAIPIEVGASFSF